MPGSPVKLVIRSGFVNQSVQARGWHVRSTFCFTTKDPAIRGSAWSLGRLSGKLCGIPYCEECRSLKRKSPQSLISFHQNCFSTSFLSLRTMRYRYIWNLCLFWSLQTLFRMFAVCRCWNLFQSDKFFFEEWLKKNKLLLNPNYRPSMLSLFCFFHASHARKSRLHLAIESQEAFSAVNREQSERNHFGFKDYRKLNLRRRVAEWQEAWNRYAT